MNHGLGDRIVRSVRLAVERVASFKQSVYQKYPLFAAFANLSFVGCERIGARVWGSRTGQFLLVLVVGMLIFVNPAAAIECTSGPLQFLADIHSLVTQSVGTVVISMVFLAGALKMIPMRGTNSWGNAVTGSVLVGVVFLVVGPGLVAIADGRTPISLSAQCTGQTA